MSNFNKYHKNLAKYFESQDYFKESMQMQRLRAINAPPTSRRVNVRKVVELPWQFIQFEDIAATEDLFTNLHFLEAGVESGKIINLLNDCQLIIELIPPHSPFHKILGIIEEAIRRNLQFIYVHPTTLFQCLWNTCWWYDSPERNQHYLSKPNKLQQDIADNTPQLNPKSQVYKLLEKWRAIKSEWTPGFRWIRSQRPGFDDPDAQLKTITDMASAHTDTKFLAFSQDSHQLLRANSDYVALWDLESNSNLSLRIPSNVTIYNVMFDSRNKPLAFVMKDKIFSAYDLSTGLEIFRFECPPIEIECVTISNNKEFIAGGFKDGKVCLWNFYQKDYRLWQSHSKTVNCCAVTSDGKLIASSDGVILRLCDTDTGAVILEHKEKCNSVALSHDNSELSMGCRNGNILRFNIQAHVFLEPLIGHMNNRYIASITYSPDDNVIASASFDLRICLWERKTASLGHVFFGHTMSPSVVIFSDDGYLFASGGYEPTVLVRNVASLKASQELIEHHSWIVDIVFSYETGYAVTVDEEGTAMIWDISTGVRIKEYKDVGSGIAFSPQGNLYALSRFDGELEVRDSLTHILLEEIDLSRNKGSMTVAFSKDSKVVGFNSCVGKVTFCNWKTFEKFAIIDQEPSSFSLSPDDKWIALMTRVPDGTTVFSKVEIFNSESATSYKTLLIPLDQSMVNIIFSQDCRYVIFSSQTDMYIWDWQSDLCLKTEIISELDHYFCQNHLSDRKENTISAIHNLIVEQIFSETIWLTQERQPLFFYPTTVNKRIDLIDNIVLGESCNRFEILHLEGDLSSHLMLSKNLLPEYWQRINDRLCPLKNLSGTVFSSDDTLATQEIVSLIEKNDSISGNNNPVKNNSAFHHVVCNLDEEKIKDNINSLQIGAEFLSNERKFEDALLFYSLVQQAIEESGLDLKQEMGKCLIGQSISLIELDRLEEAKDAYDLAIIFKSVFDSHMLNDIERLEQTFR
jgi:WD40 repeat protein